LALALAPSPFPWTWLVAGGDAAGGTTALASFRVYAVRAVADAAGGDDEVGATVQAGADAEADVAAVAVAAAVVAYDADLAQHLTSRSGIGGSSHSWWARNVMHGAAVANDLAIGIGGPSPGMNGTGYGRMSDGKE
jgi:hypothetical protein